ncbi:CdaR family protein [Tissierella sp.]|uniref:CdaR family protein n=1 Tax=Tissierella sp. TaxID=41274 RepID=UPI002865F942|nr:CdaR family protein [Tissierella sp.]MDR7857703.1 CdaR family protein [Tissierella sp.]
MKKMKNDLVLKILAFVIAIVLWAYVMDEVNPEWPTEYKNIKVTFSNTDALDKQGLVVMEPNEVTISVKVTGRRSDMGNFSPESIKAQVDLSGYKEGQVKVPIDVWLEQTSNVRVDKYEPKEILFNFDKIISKEKTVTIRTSGDLASNYVLGDIVTKTPSVFLKGPRTWVNEVAEIVGEIKLDGRKEDINISVPLKILDDQGNDVMGVVNEPSVIDVRIPVYRTVTLPIELQYTNTLPENYEITAINIMPNQIGLKGKDNIVNLSSILTKPIDINALMEGNEVEVELDLPRNVSLLNPDEKVKVSLNIEEAFTKTFEYNLSEIDIRNLSEDLALSEEDYSKNIVITLKGSKEIIESLTKEDLVVYLDLGLFKEGTWNAYIGFTVVDGLTVKDITPQPIELNIINH